jgi:hypothetical protein
MKFKVDDKEFSNTTDVLNYLSSLIDNDRFFQRGIDNFIDYYKGSIDILDKSYLLTEILKQIDYQKYCEIRNEAFERKSEDFLDCLKRCSTMKQYMFCGRIIEIEH